MDGSCRLTRQLSRFTGYRKASFDKPGGRSIGGAGKAGLLAAEYDLELTWLNYRAAVICDHCQLARIDFEAHHSSLARLQMYPLYSGERTNRHAHRCRDVGNINLDHFIACPTS